MLVVRRLAQFAIAGLLAALAPHAAAQAPTAEDFSRHAEVTEVSLSPDGKRVAMTRPSADGTSTELLIMPVDGNGRNQILRFGNRQHVTAPVWSDDTQVVVARARMEPLRAAPVSLGQLFSSDVEGRNQRTLFAYGEAETMRARRYRDEGHATLIDVLDAQPGTVLVEFDPWRRTPDEAKPTIVYQVDTRTGGRREIERSENTASFTADRAGRLRLRVMHDLDGNPILAYKPDPAGGWQPVPPSLAGYSMQLLRFDKDNTNAYALIADAGEPARLYRVDLAKGTRVRLAGRDDMAIAEVMMEGRDGPPFGVRFDAAKPVVEYLDPASDWAGLHAGLMDHFRGQLVSLEDVSRDGKTVLVFAWGDRNPGAWHVWHADEKRLRLVAESRPWLKASQLAPVRPITFTASDGLAVHGFLTAPASDGPRPLVVLPHGGPHGPYDRWGYDPDAQFLASRGYGVLQVNYRGSGGRGMDFERKGYRQWGGRMQDDIADGVKWAIAQKLADPQRICSFGASYGGYAAMMQVIRFPELYRCAIGYVGVYDLDVFRKEGDIPDSGTGRRYLEQVIGSDAETIREWSPARNVAGIKVPVMLVQGALDKRVPMDQLNALNRAMSAAGVKAETMVASDEGHGFYSPENRAELYRRIEAFLGRHIGAGTP